jgi:hypothetical protein
MDDQAMLMHGGVGQRSRMRIDKSWNIRFVTRAEGLWPLAHRI